MPWKECHVVDERLRFIVRLLDGEKMARLCAEFGISRKTGYKIYDRYKDCGAEALTDRSRRPYRYANRLPPVVEQGILRLKREFPSWGAPKIRERLRGQLPACGVPPSAPCMRCWIAMAWCARAVGGAIGPRARRCRSRRSPMSCGAPTTRASSCCESPLCYPLTITDFASRYLLSCDALSTTAEVYAFTAFERAFRVSASHARCAPTMACPSPPRTRLRPQPARGVVAAARYRDRTHPAGPSRAESSPRAHAPHAEARGHETGRRQRAPAAGPLRCLPGLLQP